MSYLIDNIHDAYNLQESFMWREQEVYISNIDILATKYGRKNICRYLIKPVCPIQYRKSNHSFIKFSDSGKEYEISLMQEIMSLDKLVSGLEKGMFEFNFIKNKLNK